MTKCPLGLLLSPSHLWLVRNFMHSLYDSLWSKSGGVHCFQRAWNSSLRPLTVANLQCTRMRSQSVSQRVWQTMWNLGGNSTRKQSQLSSNKTKLESQDNLGHGEGEIDIIGCMYYLLHIWWEASRQVLGVGKVCNLIITGLHPATMMMIVDGGAPLKKNWLGSG